MNRRFWQSGCRRCSYVTGPYYEDEWADAERAAHADLESHIINEHTEKSGVVVNESR